MPFDAEYTYTPRERLLLIADALDHVHPLDFCLGSWATCALGWGIKTHGSALGMKLQRGGPYFDDGKYAFEGPTPWARLAEHLGIDERTCAALFGGIVADYGKGRHPTPKEAAAHIRWIAYHKMVGRSRLNFFHFLPSLRNLAA